MGPLAETPEHVIRTSTVCLQALVSQLCPGCRQAAKDFQRYFRELEALAQRLTDKKAG